jgi:beta-lactam-binding protein with PASTA domain
VVALGAAAVLVAGCGSSADRGAFPEDGASTDTATDTATDSGDAVDADAANDTGEAVAPSTMPDVVGMPEEEAVAELEELGFQVSTGVVRTTEVEPGIVYRSEPAPGRQVREGQRVTLRISAEPRE